MSANPHQWAYMKHMTGGYINIVQYDNMVRRYHEKQSHSLLEQACKVSGNIAIASGLLTKRQRLKYAANRVRDGRKVYYLFPGSWTPADVGCRVEKQDGVFIYT